jgi:kinesin family protein C1
MLGSQDLKEQRGVIPRSLEQIFKTSQAMSSQGWSFRMQASMLEIYNETIRDLLSRPSKENGSENGTPAKQYIVKHDPSGNTIVSDLTLVDVTNWKEVSSLLQRASQSRYVSSSSHPRLKSLALAVQCDRWRDEFDNIVLGCMIRSVGKTAMNEQSSRSHCVFTLRITGTNEVSYLSFLTSCLNRGPVSILENSRA